MAKIIKPLAYKYNLKDWIIEGNALYIAENLIKKAGFTTTRRWTLWRFVLNVFAKELKFTNVNQEYLMRIAVQFAKAAG